MSQKLSRSSSWSTADVPLCRARVRRTGTLAGMSTRIGEETWGPWRAIRLEDETLSVLVVPAVGGRIVSLVDRRSGRDWMMQGGPPDLLLGGGWGREEAVFGGRESFGWDECLPTVSPCADPLDAAAPPLRDHGDQWGRPAEAHVDVAGGGLDVTWSGTRWPYHFVRRLSLEGGVSLLAAYTLTNESERPMPLLWSLHPTFRLEPGTCIELPGVSEARVTATVGLELSPADAVAWPLAPSTTGGTIELSRVRAADGSAVKLYAPAPEAARLVTPDGSVLELRWDRAMAPTVGVWLSFGGWPAGGPPVEQVAIEPTTSPDDHLADALAHERACIVDPGATLRWWVRLTARAAR
jgi:galactose mutarotase-like enzyme